MFKLGKTVVTAGVLKGFEDDVKNEDGFFFYGFVMDCFDRYRRGDWGDLCIEDAEMNAWAIENGGRVFASYDMPDGVDIDGETKIWIITEWDRSVTTILFPGEY